MRLTAENTSKVVQINGVDARIWEATTQAGVPCRLYVTRIEVGPDPTPKQCEEFERELLICKAPTQLTVEIPARMIL